MLQRYKISVEPEAGCEWINDELEYTNIATTPDDNGEWVKWEDVEKLILEGRIISKESVDLIKGIYTLLKSNGLIKEDSHEHNIENQL